MMPKTNALPSSNSDLFIAPPPRRSVSRDTRHRSSAVAAELKWLTTTELADILGLAPQTIYNKLQTCPESLPTVTRIPGIRGPRWSQQAVRQFQAQFDPPGVGAAPPRRGRPTKAEQIARRTALAQA
jgi:hypothetical protein